MCCPSGGQGCNEGPRDGLDVDDGLQRRPRVADRAIRPLVHVRSAGRARYVLPARSALLVSSLRARQGNCVEYRDRGCVFAHGFRFVAAMLSSEPLPTCSIVDADEQRQPAETPTRMRSGSLGLGLGLGHARFVRFARVGPPEPPISPASRPPLVGLCHSGDFRALDYTHSSTAKHVTTAKRVQLERRPAGLATTTSCT